MKTDIAGDPKVVKVGLDNDEALAREVRDAASRGHLVWATVNGFEAAKNAVARLKGLGAESEKFDFKPRQGNELLGTAHPQDKLAADKSTWYVDLLEPLVYRQAADGSVTTYKGDSSGKMALSPYLQGLLGNN